MPLYDYVCLSCKNEKEVQHSMSEVGKIEVVCDKCGSQMKKQLSTPTLIGFDEVGRSVTKKDKAKGETKGVNSQQESPSKKDAA